jgi:5-dehydro-2-deoxygluconokinase
MSPTAPHSLWPSLAQARALDLICLGRAGVDLYAVQKDTALEDVQQFHKSVGGSPANIATAVARLGGKSAVLGLVADDGLGRSVRQFLQRNGVDTQALGTSQDRSLTSLALTEMRAEDCKVIIYRERAADLQLSEADIDPDFIASSRALLISGTAMSVEPSRQACIKAINAARRAACLVLLDMDYRPYGWRNPQEAAHWLRWACAHSDMVIGNTEEFALLLDDAAVAPGKDGSTENVTPLQQVQRLAPTLLTYPTQAVVLKQGARGCELFTQDAAPLCLGAYRVQAQKPMGSGDAFAGALWWAICQGAGWEEALSSGAAAAAINVSRDTCAEAMPRQGELTAFMREHTLGVFA